MHPRAHRPSVRPSLLLVVLALAGCLSQPAVPPDSGIYGVATLGPTCPVERDPPDPGCADRPYEGALRVTTPDGARVVATFSTDPAGKFNVSVAPGAYVLGSTGERWPVCASEGEVVVAEGRWTRANVSCDTGIR